MSSTAPSAAPAAVQTVLSNIAATAQSGLTSAITTELTNLTGEGVGLLGQEAQDFDNLTDNLVEALEAGQTFAQAWSSATATFVAAEKSQLMQDAVSALSQLGNVVDGFTKTLEAIL